jgi:hypothetical protein
MIELTPGQITALQKLVMDTIHNYGGALDRTSGEEQVTLRRSELENLCEQAVYVAGLAKRGF